MLKKILIIFIVCFLSLGQCFAINNNGTISNFEVIAKFQSKDDYPFKKVNRKYDSLVLNVINNNSSAVITNANTEIMYKINDNFNVMPRRIDVYKKTRKRDIGKYWGVSMPCAVLSGGIIGITFGLGTPVAIGVGILGNMPAKKATAKNYEFAQDAYLSRALPLRFEPNQTYQFRVFIEKRIRPKEIVLTNVSLESNKNKFYDLILNCEIK